jgi:hypothetical protein
MRCHPLCAVVGPYWRAQQNLENERTAAHAPLRSAGGLPWGSEGTVTLPTTIILAHVHSATGYEVAVWYPPPPAIPDWQRHRLTGTQRAGYVVIAPVSFFSR